MRRGRDKDRRRKNWNEFMTINYCIDYRINWNKWGKNNWTRGEKTWEREKIGEVKKKDNQLE